MRKKVLFVCVHNSARSQMAEAFVRSMAGDRFDVESAGLEPGSLHPLAVEAMKEIGIDISKNTTKSVFDSFKEGRLFDYVITVCDESSGEMCPVFPGITQRLHWNFDDTSTFRGSWGERVAETSQVRERIKGAIEAWLREQP